MEFIALMHHVGEILDATLECGNISSQYNAIKVALHILWVFSIRQHFRCNR